LNRIEFAAAIVDTSPEELWDKYGISRCSEITNYDIVGVPIYRTCRPLSGTLSLHSGKSLDTSMSKAGAIMEAAEFHVAEHPTGGYRYFSYSDLEDALDWRECPLVRNSIIHDATKIAWDWCEDLYNGDGKYIPSDLIWMAPRVPAPFAYFQTSSNGLAAGISVEDATESALYECIERDAWTLEAYRQKPKYIDISEYDSPILQQIRAAGLIPIVSESTTDIGIPVYGTILLDAGDPYIGSYMGYGCRSDSDSALDRSLLEAVQGRCVYIAGDRDDLMRRNFVMLKGYNNFKSIAAFREMRTVKYQSHSIDVSVQEKLNSAGFTKVYRKVLHEGLLNGQSFAVVRVFVPGLEVPQFDYWHPSKRCIK
jgi:ribosomal protein S12 methylthiotransferase accessory factor